MLLLVLAVCSIGLACTEGNSARNLPAGTLQLQGAGATFPAPLYKKWLEEYQKLHPEVQLSYEAIGSGDGIAKRAGLAMAWLENKAGQFVQPHGGSGLATLLHVALPENLRAFSPIPTARIPIPL